MQSIITFLITFGVYLCGVLSGMALVHKMYKKTINKKEEMLGAYKEVTDKLEKSNIELTQIINSIFSRNDYESLEHLKKWLKEEIKKALDDAGKQY